MDLKENQIKNKFWEWLETCFSFEVKVGVYIYTNNSVGYKYSKSATAQYRTLFEKYIFLQNWKISTSSQYIIVLDN